MICLNLQYGGDALFQRIIFFLASTVLVVWSIKKLAPESIQPAPNYGEVSAVYMPEQRWVIDLLFALRVECEPGIGKLDFYSPPYL